MNQELGGMAYTGPEKRQKRGTENEDRNENERRIKYLAVAVWLAIVTYLTASCTAGLVIEHNQRQHQENNISTRVDSAHVAPTIIIRRAPCPFIYLTLFTCKEAVIKNKRKELFSLSNCRVNFSSKSPLLNRSAIKPDISNIWTLTWKARTTLIYKYTDDKSNIKLPESIAPTKNLVVVMQVVYQKG